MAFDLISIGDTVLDTFVPLEDAKISEIDGKVYLCLPFGAKIPVADQEHFVGGNAANNAVGAVRLNLKTAIYTNIGKKDDDESDERIIQKLKREGVDTRYVISNKDFPTNHNIILNYKNERSILVHHQEWKYSLPDLENSKWVYLTSLAPNFTETNIIDQILNYLHRTGAKLFYQPGTFQINLGIKKNSKILSLSEVLILNLEEAKKLLGNSEKEKIEVKKLLKKLQESGPKVVIITDGSNGSYSFDGERYLKLESFPAKLLQKTGAGDAYSVGVLAAFFHGENLEEAMRWGAANSSAVVEELGPQVGLLTINKMKDKIKETKEILSKEF